MYYHVYLSQSIPRIDEIYIFVKNGLFSSITVFQCNF